MRVESLALDHFRCFDETTLALEPGVTVVHGVNGSGKTTLLDGVFFALYGADALDDQTLDDVITIGEDEAAVSLSFTHDGESYTVERELRVRGDRATTTTCTLTPPTGAPIEGVTDVGERIESLLRMDASSFVNCAYVRQGEVNTLIHASPAERQDMIDDLLQLGALEHYRDRAGEARLGVKSVLDGQRDVVESLREQIADLEADDPHADLNALESERAELDDELETERREREELQETIADLEDTLGDFEEIREAIESLEEEVESLRSTIGETEAEREDIADDLRECREAIETREEELREHRSAVDLGETTVEERLEELDDADEDLRDALEDHRTAITRTKDALERLEDERDDLQARREELVEEHTALEEAIEADTATIEERREALAAQERQRDTLAETFDQAPVSPSDVESHRETLTRQLTGVTTSLSETDARLEALESTIEERESLAAAGQCPTCGQPVEEAPHLHDLEEQRAEHERLTERRSPLEDRRQAIEGALERARELVETATEMASCEAEIDRLEAVIDERESAIDDRRERLETLTTEYESIAEDLEALDDREAALETQLDEERAALGEVNGERRSLDEERSTLESIQECTEAIDSLEAEMESLRERRSSLAELNEERRDRLSEKQSTLSERREAVDEARIEALRERLTEAREDLEARSDRIESLEERRDEVQSAIGAAEQAIETLEEQRARLETVEARRDHLETIYEDAETLEETYGDLRSSLRQRNVATLERLVNETFDLLYRNDAYASIELDGDYGLTVYQKDGEPIAPERLSGGERALFNLSLRCAIYRLLAEGEHGSAPMPPLILDEPTVYLDDGHVTQLLELVDSMRSIGVEQIVVVSHDEELVGAADRHVLVEKDPTSNRSQIVSDDPVRLRP